MNVVAIKGAVAAPRAMRSKMDTIEVTQDLASQWRIPPFQRPLRVNDKVRGISEEIGETGIIPGVLTLGQIDSGSNTYIVDGQHRIEAFKISAINTAYVDVRVCDFDSMADMGRHFAELNSQIVKMRPDDMLRGLEGSVDALRHVRKECPFVGYTNIRRGDTASALVSMSQR